MGPIGGLIIFWIILSLIVATFGSDKKIGYWGVFWCSLLLSPIVTLSCNIAFGEIKLFLPILRFLKERIIIISI